MMAIMNNVEAQQALQALTELARVKLPVSGALRVRKIIKALQAHMEDVEAVRIDIIGRYAKRDEDGHIITENNQENGTVVFEDDDAKAEFLGEYQKLMAETWETDLTIRVSDLGSGEIEPAVLIALGDLLEEEIEA